MVQQPALSQSREAFAVAEVAGALPAPLLRLHLQIKVGTLPAILDQVQVAGQAPRFMVFEQGHDTAGLVILDFDRINEQAAATLVAWINKVPGVVHVELEWRADNRPEHRA
jgi:hypothetical protein